MGNKQGWWYLLSMLGMPFLFLARTGLFGASPREEAEAALQDWAVLGRALLTVAIVVALGIGLGILITGVF